MKNFLFIIAFLIVLTTVIVGINPQMHKPMNIGRAELVVQNDSNIKNTDLKVENKNSIIDKTPVAVKPVDAIKSVENIETKNVDINDKWEQLLKIQEQEEQARIQAEQKRQAQLQKQKEEYARKLAQQKAQEDAKRKAEEQAQKLAAQKAQQEAKKKADEEAKRLAVQKRLQEEQAKKLAQQKAQEEAKKKFEAEALAKKQAEEQARKLAEQKAAEEARKKAEAEALAKKQAEEQAKKLAQQKAQEEAKKKAEEQKKLVEYQENILWNQWRANVCNNVASRLNQQFTSIAPVGTIYTYSFDVDNQRRITNINVKISKGYVNATTQQGVAMIYNAIQSLNLSTSLTFPSGSQRTTVKVSSGIERTSAQSKNIDAYSFNDVEKVTKQKY